jgi:hypothetical protein
VNFYRKRRPRGKARATAVFWAGMGSTLPSRHISIAIDRPPREVYDFAGNGENLPRWASGLSGGTIERSGDFFVADSPMGRVKIRFVERNDLGVLDHDVTLPDGQVFNNPMRVVANGGGGGGSEVTFVLFRRPGVSDEEFAADIAMIERDLRELKQILEREAQGA